MDLFGFLTTANSAKDLVLGQKATSVEAQIAELWHTALLDHDRDLDQFDACPARQALKARFKIDRTYDALESLVDQLGSLRDERKTIIFIANDLSRDKSSPALEHATGPGFPKVGITSGRIGIGDHANGQANDQFCMGETKRLAAIDFDERYRNLLKTAREQNVTFYPVTPAGLLAPGATAEDTGYVDTVAIQAAVRRANENVSGLAHETDGIAIVNTNDLSGGMKRIADDLAAYYILGYYTTNTKWDGAVRTIKVRLKSSGETIRARRQYRAPTQEEINDLIARPAPGTRGTAKPATDRETALAVLERASRPFAAYTALNGKTLTVVTELSPPSIQRARWKDGADVQISASAADGKQVATGRGRIDAGAYVAVVPLTIDPASPPTRLSVVLSGPGERPVDDWLNLPRSTAGLVGDPMAYRSASRVAPRPIAAFEFARNERIRIEWPVLAASLDRREVRLLDHAGKPLSVEIPLSEDSARKLLIVDVSLSGLPHGDYLFDLTVGSGGTTEEHLLAVRMKS
jgi:VWFA-related protein